MTAVSWPSTVPVQAEDLRLVVPKSVFTSPLSGAHQELIHPGARWSISLQTSDLDEDAAVDLSIYLDEMASLGLRALYAPAIGHGFRGTLAGGDAPVADGAGQSGMTLVTRGWAVGSVIRRGALIAVECDGIARLHRVRADRTISGATAQPLTIVPPLRGGGPADGSPISIGAAAAGTFRLAGEAPAIPWRVPLWVPSVNLTLEEALP